MGGQKEKGCPTTKKKGCAGGGGERGHSKLDRNLNNQESILSSTLIFHGLLPKLTPATETQHLPNLILQEDWDGGEYQMIFHGNLKRNGIRGKRGAIRW